jgi:hypothetical protein
VPRLHAYNADVAALAEWLRRFESLRPIDGERSVDAIAADVKAIVDAKLAAVAAAKAAAAAEAARIAAEAEEKAAAAAEAARQKAEAEEKARLEWEAVRLSGTRGSAGVGFGAVGGRFGGVQVMAKYQADYDAWVAAGKKKGQVGRAVPSGSAHDVVGSAPLSTASTPSAPLSTASTRWCSGLQRPLLNSPLRCRSHPSPSRRRRTRPRWSSRRPRSSRTTTTTPCAATPQRHARSTAAAAAVQPTGSL